MRENLVEKRSEWRSEPAVKRLISQGEFATDAWILRPCTVCRFLRAMFRSLSDCPCASTVPLDQDYSHENERTTGEEYRSNRLTEQHDAQ